MTKAQVKLQQVLKINIPGMEFHAVLGEVEAWIKEEGFEKGFWLGLKNAGIMRYQVRERYHDEYDKIQEWN